MSTNGYICGILTFIGCFITAFSAPDLQLYFGRILGMDKVAENNNLQYYAYYGIPFAKPPVGELRFQAPKRYRGLPFDVITTDSVRTACYQPVFSQDYVMSEDCLYLNVYAPTSASMTSVKKVMVFIYGGGFTVGDTYQYTPSRMVTEKDVIVITFNYRLGVFGFMSSGQNDGNYGLLDQVAALQWVRENIGFFGGDPNDVTIFGESAGAMSASMLAISPLTKGLFSKVILQSGTALVPGIIDGDRGAQFDKLAKVTGCAPWFYSSWLRSKFAESITNCLRTVDPQELQSASFSLHQSSPNPVYFEDLGKENLAAFQPTVDGNVLPRHPQTLLNDRAYLREIGALDRSFIMGFNNNEALFFAELFVNAGGSMNGVNNLTNANAHLDQLMNDKFRLGVPEEFKAVAEYEYMYPRTAGRPPLEGVLNLGSDYVFIIPTIRFARYLKAADDTTKVFLYLFDHNPQVTNPSVGVSGSSHAMELAYLFDQHAWLSQYSYYTTVPNPSGSDSQLFDVLQGAWTQFAKTGSPEGYLPNNSGAWKQYDRTEEFYLAISKTPEQRQHVYAKRVALWTEILR